jgi:hypothetical protein
MQMRKNGSNAILADGSGLPIEIDNRNLGGCAFVGKLAA